MLTIYDLVSLLSALLGIICWMLSLQLEHFDRLITDDYGYAAAARKGFVRIHTKASSDEILGATIVAANAGELISFFTLAIHAKVGAKVVADVIAPYPTVSEAMKYTANQVCAFTTRHCVSR